MSERDRMLRDLQGQIGRKQELQAKKEKLFAQKSELQKRLKELERVRDAEQADVDKLEGRTPAAFFYTMIGRKEKKLNREKQEARAAAAQYDTAAGELDSVVHELEDIFAELRGLKDCEERFRSLVAQKADEIRDTGTPEAERILELEERLARNAAGQKEIREAVRVGHAALSTADSILRSLDSAEKWGVWDLSGGGIFADITKHGHLDDAQEKIEQLQGQLRRFHTELADTRIYADLNVKVDGFLLFADYFFDDPFSSWRVLDHISNSIDQMNEVHCQIQNALNYLDWLADNLRSGSGEIQTELDSLVVSA